jgi:hypothetical protein
MKRWTALFRKYPVRSTAITLLFLLLIGTGTVVILFESIVSTVIARPEMQAWIKSEVEEESGGKFTFSGTKGNLLSVDLTDVVFESGSKTNHVRKLTVPRLTASFALLPILLQRDLQLKALTFHEADLDFQLGGTQPNDFLIPIGFETIRLVKSRITVTNLSGWKLIMESAGGTVHQTRESKKFELTAESGVMGAFRLKALALNAEIAANGLRVNSLKAKLEGGNLSAKGNLSGGSGGTIRDFDLTLTKFDLASMLTTLDFSDQVTGSATLNFKGGGSWTPRSFNLKGSGEVQLVDTTVRLIRPDVPNIPFFAQVTIWDRIETITGLNGSLKYQTESQAVSFTELKVENPDMQVEGSGKVHLDRRITAQLQVGLGRELAQGIPSVGRGQFKSIEGGGRLIPCEIIGTTRNPKLKVDVTALGSAIDVIDTINPLRLFR